MRDRRCLIIKQRERSSVEYSANARFRSENRDIQVVRARKLVLTSAGAFGSPAILERSGIGSSELLSRLQIETSADLPGVGEH